MIRLVFFLCLYATIAESSLENGDPCVLTDGKPGVCKVMSQCQSVFERILAGELPDTVCKRSNVTESIVCCPSTSAITTSAALTLIEEPGDGRGAIARQKCAEYAQYVYTLVSTPPIGTLVNVSQCAFKSRKLITGGRRADHMEFPHMAAVGYNLSEGTIGWHCGGSLISENFVLTAAHCTYSKSGGHAAWVRVGDSNLVREDDGASPVNRLVTQRIRHPQYKAPSQYHDIALLRLESRVPFNRWIRPACLHTAASTGTLASIATGWGRVDWMEDEGSSDLLKVTLPLVDHSTCSARWPITTSDPKLPNGIVNDWMICAGAPGRDTCQGDSGGPLVIYSKDEYYCMYDIVGITSIGKLCGTVVPGIYTRVYNYVSWIESEVWGQG